MISRKALDHFYILYMSFIDRCLASGVKIKVWNGWVTGDGGQTLCGLTTPDADDEDHYTVHVASADKCNQVATMLHEFSHKMFPYQEEEWIRCLEKDLITSFSTDQLKTFEKYLM